MKKNRTSFFNESTDYTQFNQNTLSQNIPNQNMLYPANGMYPPNISAQSSFQTNNMPMMNQPMPNPNMPMPLPNTDNIESKLAKMERQIARLEHRVTKLETNTTLSTDDFNNTVNDMYMV